MATDPRKRLAPAKGSVTKVQTQLDHQQSTHPHKRNQSTFNHLKDLLTRAEDNYSESFDSIEDPTDEESDAYTDFLSNVMEARSRIDVYTLQSQGHQIKRILEGKITSLERSDPTDLPESFAAGQARLEKLRTDLEDTIYAPGATDMDDLILTLDDLNSRIDKLRKRATPTLTPTPDKDVGEDAHPVKQGLKAKTLPIPTFHGNYRIGVHFGDDYWSIWLDSRVCQMTNDLVSCWMLSKTQLVVK